MEPQSTDKPHRGSEKPIRSLDPLKEAADLARRQLAVRQKSETKEVQEEETKERTKVIEKATEARADLLASSPERPPAQPAESPNEFLELWRVKEMTSRLGDSSICPDLVDILQKKAGYSASGSPKSQFAGFADYIVKNLSTYDAGLAEKVSSHQTSVFEAFTIIVGKMIAEEAASAAPDKRPRLKEVADTFQMFVEAAKKLTKDPDQAQQTPSGQPTVAPQSTPTASEPEKPKNFFAGLMDKLKGFFASISTVISGFFNKLFGKKPETSTPAPTPIPTATPVSDVSAPISTPLNPEILLGADTTVGLKGAALFNNPQFQTRTDQIANKIGVSRADLYAIFKMESGGDPAIQNKITHATGLIQWMPQFAPSGTTVDTLKQMSGLQQLDYVEKYYQPYFGRLKSFSDLYRAVFWPASIGKGPDYIFQTKRLSAQKVAAQNPGMATDNGVITNASFERTCAKMRPRDSDTPLSSGGNIAVA